VAALYNRGLGGHTLQGDGLQLPVERPGCKHVYHQFTVRSPRRDALQKYLSEQGVGAIVYYPKSLHLQNVYQELGYKAGDFPVSEMVQEQVLSLPMYPELQSAQAEEVVQAVRRYLSIAAAQVG
jgi:dTDP-4-amino-4,6-dideoxygalactose transaminase